MVNVRVVQPEYFCGENPDKKIAEFLISEMQKVEKYMRSAGYGEGLVKNNDFISDGLCPEVF